MLKFEPITKYEKGIVSSLLLQSFAEVVDKMLEEKIKQYDRDVFENPDSVGACIFISTLNGKSVGMASWDPRQGPELGIIGWICTLPEFQGNGFGKAQIKEILGRLKQDGFKKAFVRTGEHPFFTSAQKMYTACGFKESKKHPTGDQPGYGTIDYEIELNEDSNCITSITPTICKLMKIAPPSLSDGDIIQSLIEKAEVEQILQIKKCLLYAPDAIGTHLHKKYPGIFAKILQYAPFEVSLCSVVPPKTPVCFASMFTGAMPDVHGIQEYKKPILKCDTLFDALIRGGKKIAIIAVADSSIDCIFRNRKIDYFSEIYDEQVTDRTLELIEADEHDFILAYHQEYDDTLHKSTPESETAIEAFENHVNSFVTIASYCESAWKEYDRLIMFTPDHGAHIDSATGRGTHGKDIPEDMEICHYYNIVSGKYQ